MRASADVPLGPQHRLEFGVDISWVDERYGITARYLEVESPLDQNRVGGEGPRPWGREPRYAWMLTNHGRLHIAGLYRLTRYGTDPKVAEWSVLEFHIPWINVRTLEVKRHADWEGKPQDVEK